MFSKGIQDLPSTMFLALNKVPRGRWREVQAIISAAGSSRSNWADEAATNLSENDYEQAEQQKLKDEITGLQKSGKTGGINGELSWVLMDRIWMVEKKQGDTTDGDTATRGSDGKKEAEVWGGWPSREEPCDEDAGLTGRRRKWN